MSSLESYKDKICSKASNCICDDLKNNLTKASILTPDEVKNSITAGCIYNIYVVDTNKDAMYRLSNLVVSTVVSFFTQDGVVFLKVEVYSGDDRSEE